MEITVTYLGEQNSVELEVGNTIDDILVKLSIPSSTVLVVKEGEILPFNTVLKRSCELELVVISSGG